MDRKRLLPTVLVATVLLSATFAAALDNRIKLKTEIDKLWSKPEAIKQLVPATFEEVDAKIVPIKTRFLMWTKNGVHVMWGQYGNGFFTGTDDLGVKVRGIYGRSVFAGFYNGEFFYGRYNNGNWMAIGLFGEKISTGKYVTFPPIIAEPSPLPVETGAQ